MKGKEHLKVGDQVSFTVNGTICFDEVTYIDGATVEGKKYDLTHAKDITVKKIEKN
jgi:hypothetical protein